MPTKAELEAKVKELENAVAAAKKPSNRATDLAGFLAIVTDELVPAIVAAFGADLSAKERDERLSKVANLAQKVYKSDLALRPGPQDGKAKGSKVRSAADKIRESAYSGQSVGSRVKK